MNNQQNNRNCPSNRQNNQNCPSNRQNNRTENKKNQNAQDQNQQELSELTIFSAEYYGMRRKFPPHFLFCRPFCEHIHAKHRKMTKEKFAIAVLLRYTIKQNAERNGRKNGQDLTYISPRTCIMHTFRTRRRLRSINRGKR